MQEGDNSLLSLILDFDRCRVNRPTGYDSMSFPSLCGEGRSAVPGLREILRLANATNNSTESTVLMITNGMINDSHIERTNVVGNLTSAGITIIAIGIKNADVENLMHYTSKDNVFVQDYLDLDFGFEVLSQMVMKGILCQEEGND